MTTLRLVRDGCEPAGTSRRLGSTGAPARAHPPLSDGTLSRYLDEQLRFMFGTAARVYAAFELSERFLSDSGGFTDEIDEMLQARIPIRPKSFEMFSSCLHVDVVRSLRRSGEVRRRWGRIESTTRGVLMHVEPRPPLTVELGERATVIK